MSSQPPTHGYQGPPHGESGYPGPPGGYPGGYQGPPGGYQGPPPRTGSNTALIVVVALAFVLLLGAVAYLLTRGDDVGEYSASSTTPAASVPAASAEIPVAAAPPAAPAPAAPAPTSAAPSAAPPQPAASTGSSSYTGSVSMNGLRQFCETYDQTSVARYKGLMVCYNIQMQQRSDGTFSGTGYKSWEVLPGTNGRDLDPSEQSPIRVTGSVDANDAIRMRYTVQGERRATTGTATFDGGRTVIYSSVGGDSEDFPGTFRSNAANASGSARISSYALRD